MTQEDRTPFAVATDLVVLTGASNDAELLLIERLNPPFEGCWALPGGFLETTETLEEGARRELREETGVAVDTLDQVGAFWAPGRDPRGPVLSVAYVAVVDKAAAPVKAADDARDARWFALAALPDLAFDHAEILAKALHQIQQKAG